MIYVDKYSIMGLMRNKETTMKNRTKAFVFDFDETLAQIGRAHV